MNNSITNEEMQFPMEHDFIPEIPYVPYKLNLLEDILYVSSESNIKDYLPEKDVKVIAVTVEDFFSAYHDGNNWIHSDGGGVIDRVINWYEVKFI